MVPRRISTHGERCGTRRTLDTTNRRKSKSRRGRTKTRAKSAQHSGRHGVHVTVQATEGEVHASDLFAMLPTTLEKAISKNQLKGIPMMNVKDIYKHLPPSPATSKGRMKKPRGGVRSTRREKKISLKKSWKNKSNWIRICTQQQEAQLQRVYQ